MKLAYTQKGLDPKKASKKQQSRKYKHFNVLAQ